MDEDFNIRTATIVANAADNLGWSLHDICSSIADNDDGLKVPNDHFDKLLDKDVGEWCDAITPTVIHLIERDYIELPNAGNNFDELADFAQLLSAIRKEAQKKTEEQ